MPVVPATDHLLGACWRPAPRAEMPCSHPPSLYRCLTQHTSATSCAVLGLPPCKGLAIGVDFCHAEQAPCQHQRCLPARGKALIDREIGKVVGSTKPRGATGRVPAGGHPAHRLAPLV